MPYNQGHPPPLSTRRFAEVTPGLEAQRGAGDVAEDVRLDDAARPDRPAGGDGQCRDGSGSGYCESLVVLRAVLKRPGDVP